MKKLVFALVLALGLGVFAALPASAESGKREAEIAYRSIKIVLDGLEICPRDAKGNEVEPFILDGTTYLPVRAVAEALGLEVRWRGSDSTVLLTRDADEHDFFSVSAVGLPPEPPRKAESANGHNAVERVTLGYRDIRVLVDGVVIRPKDAGGNVVEPFTLNGTTYLPVRAVAEALGLAVDWDAETGTVRLSHWLVSRRHEERGLGIGDPYYWSTDEYEYDALGRVVYHLGRKTRTDCGETLLSYDETGRLARREVTMQELGESAVKFVTSYAYDSESGLCVSAETTTDKGAYTEKTEYEYDALGRLVRAVQSSGGKRDFTDEWTYDEAGRITGLRETLYGTNKSEWTEKYAYDAEGRLAHVEHEARGSWTEEPYNCWQMYFSYDADGREVVYGMRGSSDGDVEERSVYDETGRLISKEWAIYVEADGKEYIRVTEYFYDERGLLARTRTSDGRGDENEVVYTYDANGNRIRCEERVSETTDTTTWEYVKAGD